MIELLDIRGGYDGAPLMDGLNLTVPDGAITAVIGPNGCGKSTLLRLMCGLQKPWSGRVLLNGRDISGLSGNELARTVSILPQSRSAASIRVESLVLHGRFPYMGYPRRYRAADRQAAREAMEFAGVAHLAGRNVSTLSGGERQKVYIAMLLAQGTPIALLDEPTSSLDIAHKFDVMRLARQMKDAGKTVVLVLHDLELALTTADRVVLMERGQIRSWGTPEELYRSGALEQVFQVHVRRLETPDGPTYAFHPI